MPLDRRLSPSSRRGEGVCARQSGRSPAHGFRASPSSPGVRGAARELLPSVGGAEEGENAKDGRQGLKYLGSLSDSLGEETVEVRQSVLNCRPRNPYLLAELDF